jgi:hypothetical protein
MAGVFIRPDLVIEPGLSQMMAALLILVPTIGITFSMQASYSDRAAIDRPVRLALAACALLALLHPDEMVAALACVPVVAMIGYWVVRRRAEQRRGQPQSQLSPSFVGSDAARPRS